MAMDGTVLGDSIASLVMSQTPASSQEDANNAIKTLWESIGTAIVSHIQTYGVVTVASGIAVSTTGSAAAQTGVTTTTGTGSIS